MNEELNTSRQMADNVIADIRERNKEKVNQALLKEASTGIAIQLDNVEANFQTIFPFLTGYKRDEKIKEITIPRKIKDKEGNRVDVKLVITKNEKSQWPGPIAGNILLVFAKMLSDELCKNDFVENPILYHRGTLCKTIGIGENADVVRKEIENLHHLHFHSYGTYYHKRNNEYIGTTTSKKSWYPIPEIEDITKTNKDGKEITKYSLIWFNQKFIDNYNDYYLGKIDIDFALSLKAPMASKLYQYFSRVFYVWHNVKNKQDFIPFSYETLCNNLTLKRERYHYNRMKQFKVTLQELKDKLLLKNFKWVKKNDNDSILRVWPGKRSFIEVKEKERRQKRFDNTKK